MSTRQKLAIAVVIIVALVASSVYVEYTSLFGDYWAMLYGDNQTRPRCSKEKASTVVEDARGDTSAADALRPSVKAAREEVTVSSAASPSSDEENKNNHIQRSKENDEEEKRKRRLEHCEESIFNPEYAAVFPKKAMTLKDLELCNHEFQVVLKGSLDCKNDTTCLACTQNYIGERFNKLKKGFDKEENKMTRMKLLKEMKENQKDERVPIIAMFASNHGQLYFLYNWACHLLLRHNIDVRKFTIVIPTDQQAGQSLEERGFKVFPYNWIDHTYKIRTHYSGEAELSSALLASKYFMIWAMNEYLPQNVSIFFQDVDVVWNKDPRPFLKEYSCEMDLVGMVDNRFDAQGFLNGGLFFVRPTLKSRVFFQTLENIMVLNTDDQTAFNSLLRHWYFSEFKWKAAPGNLFQNRVARSSTNETRERIKREALLVHAVSSPKEIQFKNIDRWDYSEEKCPTFFDKNIKTVKRRRRR